MPRRSRNDFPGAFHHVTARGNRREPIFLDDTDRWAFLDLLGEAVARFDWRCHAYCLMNNHYHLLVEIPLANLGSGMRHLGGVHTQRFNRRHHRDGHVFQGRYGSILVEKERHLLELARYLVLNPVRAGLVTDPGAWRWSSYRATAGLVLAPPYLRTGWLLDQFGPDPARAERAYRDFVAEGRGAAGPWLDRAAADAPGSAAGRGEERPSRAEPDRPTLGALRRSGGSRGAWMNSAYRRHGYTMGKIATEAGLHASSVSRIILAWERGGIEGR